MKDNVLVFIERWNEFFTFKSNNVFEDFSYLVHSINTGDRIRLEEWEIMRAMFEAERTYIIGEDELDIFEGLYILENYITHSQNLSISTKLKLINKLYATDRYKRYVKREIFKVEKEFRRFLLEQIETEIKEDIDNYMIYKEMKEHKWDFKYGFS